jgi:hypothetical protein
MGSAEQCNPVCRNMISFCGIDLFSVYFHTRNKICFYTKLCITAVLRKAKCQLKTTNI